MKVIKDIYSIAIAMIVCLMVTSCSDDVTLIENANDGEVVVRMSTTLPSDLQTYATYQPSNSALSGLTNLEDKGGLSVRYIMEVYTKTGTEPIVRKIQYKDLAKDGDYRNADFETRLIATEYKFVFWADIVSKYNNNGDEEYRNRYFFSFADENGNNVLLQPNDDYYSNCEEVNLTSAKATTCTSRMGIDMTSNEMYDAFSVVKDVDLRTDATSQSFTLTRPYTKVRIVTTDADVVEAQSDIDWSKSFVTLKNNLPREYNALTAAHTAASSGIGYWANGVQSSNHYTYSDGLDAKDNVRTLEVFYLPTLSSSSDLKLEITLKSKDGNQLVNTISSNIPIDVPNVPLVANKLVTITGNLLTKNVTPTVIINDVFDDDETVIEATKEASTPEELISKLDGGSESISYTGKITKAQSFELNFDDATVSTTRSSSPLYAEGNETTLNLSFASIEEGSVLTFKGNNTPAVLRITTNSKCSLRIDMSSSDVYYDGSTYKYIVTNAGLAGRKDGIQYDVMFGADPGDRFYPASYDNAHQFKCNADFTLPEGFKCVFVSKHENKTCDFVTKLNEWMTSNPGKTMWDFVGDVNN